MAQYLVKGESGEAKVEASNWLGALGAAMPKIGLSPGALGRLVCSVEPDGSADACDPQTGTRIRIEPVRFEAPPPIAMPTSGLDPGPALNSSFDEVFELEEATPDDVAPDMDDGGLEAIDAARSAAASEGAAPASVEAGDRMELVFERCAVIAAASDVRTACANALTILAELVPADAGSVLVRTRSGTSLRFAAAFGPTASKVIDTAIPIDQGIAGFTHGFAMGVIVADVVRDQRHYDRVDKASGYRTRSILAVPILGGDGRSYGCIELLNSPSGFRPEDLEMGQVVAGSLAAWLSPALG